MFRNILLLLVALSLTGCARINCASNNCMSNCAKSVSSLLSRCGMGSRRARNESHYVETRETSRVILTYSEKLKYEKDLQLEDANICHENGFINRIRLDFYTMAIIEMCEARELIVDVVEGLLEQLNQNSAITPYVRGDSFTADNLEIYIKFPSFYSTELDLQTVGLISLRNGTAHFVASDAFDCENDCWHRRYEPYHQSKDFVTFTREGRELYKPSEDKAPTAFEKDERYLPTDFGSPRRK